MDLKKVCCLCAMLAVSQVFAKGGAAWQNDPVVAMLRDGGSLGKAQAIDPHPLFAADGDKNSIYPDTLRLDDKAKHIYTIVGEIKYGSKDTSGMRHKKASYARFLTVVHCGKYRFEEAAAATTVTFDANNRVLSVDGPYPREEYSQEALVESDELNRDLPLAKAVCALVDRKK